MKTIGWGILGCGNIAEQFATGLQVEGSPKTPESKPLYAETAW